MPLPVLLYPFIKSRVLLSSRVVIIIGFFEDNWMVKPWILRFNAVTAVALSLLLDLVSPVI